MRAWNVKRGAIVKDDADRWQVVVDIRDLTDSAGRMLELVYATGQSEPMQPGDNVEAINRLTDSRAAALRAVAEGKVCRSWSPGYPWEWRVDDRRAGRAPYEWIRDHGLIAGVGPASARTAMREDYQLTVSGQALLAILDGKAPAR